MAYWSENRTSLIYFSTKIFSWVTHYPGEFWIADCIVRKSWGDGKYMILQYRYGLEKRGLHPIWPPQDSELFF